MNKFESIISSKAILTEGSLVERLYRDGKIELDQHIIHAGLIYSETGRNALNKIYSEYIEIGQKYKLPMITLAPTWRANPERIAKSIFSEKASTINQDGVEFLNSIRTSYGDYSNSILIGGLMGCKGDAYIPEESLSKEEAIKFHRPQAEQLARSGADFIRVATLPAATEAYGFAELLSDINRPYFISFIIRADGTLLDGTPMYQVIDKIDSTIKNKPQAYTVNCVHPNIMLSALEITKEESEYALSRISGFQANTSAKSPEELNNAEKLESAEPVELAKQIINIHNQFEIKIVGGCCGTDARHIEEIAKRL